MLRKKDFWGFSNGELFDYVRLAFPSQAQARWAAARLRKPQKLASIGLTSVQFELYEANVDPMLRFMHVRGLKPVGWLTSNAGGKAAARASPSGSRREETVCDWQHVSPRPDLEEAGLTAPLVVFAFDIECDSAHGDFPVARKDYRRLAIDIESSAWDASLCEYDAKQRIVACMRAAFAVAGSDAVTACPLQVKGRDQGSWPPAEESNELKDLELAIKRVVDDVYSALRTSPAQAKAAAAASATAAAAAPEKEDADESALADACSTIGRVTAALDRAFGKRWPLRGDAVIQIGATIGVQGHGVVVDRVVLTLGSCEPIEGAIVRAFDSELLMLLAFVALVRSVDPDVVLGYNIFGFDFAYLYERARELMDARALERDFLLAKALHRRLLLLKKLTVWLFMNAVFRLIAACPRTRSKYSGGARLIPTELPTHWTTSS